MTSYEMDPLTKLANDNKTDKGTKYAHRHGYTRKYYELLNPFREEVTTLLELGVHKGKSLRMWRDFFPNAHVYGIEINPEWQYHEERIDTALADQENEEQIEQALDQFSCREFDIIIDDGHHSFRSQLISLMVLKKYVKKHGYYFVEDAEVQGFHKRAPRIVPFYGPMLYKADSGARMVYYHRDDEY